MLGELERTFAGKPLSIIGVHTNKFPAEQRESHIRGTMAQYGVSHPVVLDSERGIWQSYAVRAWPTLVFIRPDGTVAATLPGEPDAANVDEIVSHLFDEAQRLGTLGGAMSGEAPITPARGSTSLAFPGATEPLPSGLAISDSGNHRILLADGRGRTVRVIGGGGLGLKDGPREVARFNNPQGLAYADGSLYVADAGNHALRAINLDSGEVRTVAGDGTLGKLQPSGLVPATSLGLRSPWDVLYRDGILFVAMAGFHQIWAHLPEEGSIGTFAGSGREALVDGALHDAAFAQPTALAAHGTMLYVVDSETSAVREVSLSDNRVRTLVGTGLFDFGDVDGERETARLQHVQGVSHGPNGLLISDTYNDKIKRVDEATGAVSTWFERDREIHLNEPTGISQLEGGQLLVADSHHHRVLVIDGATRRAKELPRGTDPTHPAEGDAR